MSSAHNAAVVALLRAAAVGTEATVHEGEAPDLTLPPYIVVWPSPGIQHRGERHGAPKMAVDHSSADVEVQILSVGATAHQAGWTHDLAVRALNGVTPTVAGRRCWPTVQTYSRSLGVAVHDPDLHVVGSGWLVRSTS